MAVIAETVNRTVQIGFETSPGVPAAGGANHAMNQLLVSVAAEHTNKAYTSQGHRHTKRNAQQKRWESIDVTGEVLYPEAAMVFENLFGAGTLTSPGTLARQRVYSPPLTGKIANPRTWQVQYGDVSDNVNQVLFALLNGFGVKYTRDAGMSWSGVKGVAQPHTTGVTFTASPTHLTDSPIEGPHVNFYLDATGAGLGTTQIFDEVLECDLAYDNVNGPRWVSDRAVPSYKDFVNLVTKGTVKLSLAESSVTRGFETALENGATMFLRIDAQGPTIDTTPSNTYMTLRFDVAVQLDKSNALSADGQGVDKRDFDLLIVEDLTWGHALQITNITDIATL